MPTATAVAGRSTVPPFITHETFCVRGVVVPFQLIAAQLTVTVYVPPDSAECVTVTPDTCGGPHGVAGPEFAHGDTPIAFEAFPRAVYDTPFVNPEIRHAAAPAVAVHVLDGSDSIAAVYPVIGEPPFAFGVNVTRNVPDDWYVSTTPGAAGVVAGVPVAAGDGVLLPPTFVATTVMSYARPFVNPGTVQAVAAGVPDVEQVEMTAPDRRAVAVYPVIGRPRSFGAVQDTSSDAFRAVNTGTAGASGTVNNVAFGLTAVGELPAAFWAITRAYAGVPVVLIDANVTVVAYGLAATDTGPAPIKLSFDTRYKPTVYPVTAAPPSDSGGVNVTVAARFDGFNTTFRGADGTVLGVHTTGADGGPSPVSTPVTRYDDTWKLYPTPFVNPVDVNDVVPANT